MNFSRSIVCASVIFVLSACSDNESVKTYIDKAEQSILQHESNAAVISLKNALKIDDKNAYARFLLGRLYLSNGNAENAIKELERANKLNYSVDKLVPLLARAYTLTESDAEVLLLDQQVTSLSQPNAQYLAYKTLAAIRTGDNELAQATVDAALSFSKTDGYSMLANAYFEFSKQNIQHARTLVERVLAANSNNVDALMLQGQIATVEQNYTLAVKSFQHYQELQPNSSKVQLFIADALLKNGQYEEAEKIADSILTQVPTQPFLQYIKATARFEAKDYEAASRFAIQSLNSGFNSFSLKLVAGASAFYLKNYEQSINYLTDLMPYIGSEHPARRMLAVSQLQLGQIDDISETLSDYDSAEPNNAQFLATMSYGLMELGAFEQAKKMANYASSSTEASAEEVARVGVLKLMMNDPSGIDKLELALQKNPELISAELALAFALINSGDIARAKEIADKWLEQYPDKADSYNLQSAIFLKNENMQKAETALEKSLELEPNNVYALTQMVKLAKYQEDTEKAKLLIDKAIQLYPDNIQVLRQYFDLYKNDKGLKVITQAQKNNINDVKYGTLLAEALVYLKEFNQASSVLESYSVDVKTPKRYWQLMLTINAQDPDGKDIYSILDEWQKVNPYHIESTFLLASYWVGKKLPDNALRVLQKGDEKHPNNLMLHLLKMQILLDNRRGVEARSLLTTLNNFAIDENLLAGITGRILLIERNFSAAIPKLRQQYVATPNSNNATFLAFALEGDAKVSEAIELLENFSAKEATANSIHPRVSLGLANLYLSKDKSKAIKEYEKLISVQANNIVALNNLSWLYMQEGKYLKALEYSEQAYLINSEIPNVVDTYAQALLKSGDKVKALSKAQDAYKLSKGLNIDIALNLAETLLGNNKDKEAYALLKDIKVVTVEQKEKKLRLTQ